jgi:hypothetical protein
MERIAVGQLVRTRVTLGVIGALIWSLTGIGVTPAQAYTDLSGSGKTATSKEDFRLWAPVFLTVSLPNKFIAYMEVNTRIGDDVTNIDQLLLRPAIGYQLTDNWSIWQGYAWVGNFNQKPTPQIPSNFVGENRIWQQATYTRNFESFKFMARTRMEERWIDHTSGTALRFRQMFKLTYPLPMAPDWALVGFDEIFITLNSVDSYDSVKNGSSKGPGAGIDQNRLFLGINKTFTSWLNVDLGYQNQMINNRILEGNANLINHILMINFYINL